MKLSQYAKQIGINYRTAWRWFKLGQIDGYQTPTGTIIITESCINPPETKKNEKVVIYARVSASENKSNLDSQAERLESYCMAKGYQICKVVKEIGSGINDKRRELIKVLKDPSITRIVVEHKDRLTKVRGWCIILKSLRSNALSYTKAWRFVLC